MSKTQHAGEYKLQECKIISSRGVIARLDDKVIGFQIYENLFSQSLIASMSIIDNVNMVMKLPIIGQEFEEYPSMGEYDTSNMASLLGYGGGQFGGGSDEDKRKAAAIQTVKAVGADTNNQAVQDVMDNLTRDYRDVMKAVEKKKGK